GRDHRAAPLAGPAAGTGAPGAGRQLLRLVREHLRQPPHRGQRPAHPVPLPELAGAHAMKLPGRFEWKILAAVLLVAVIALGTATYALQFILQRMGSVSVEHHRQIGGASDRAAEVFLAYFTERKEEFRRKAKAIA